MPDLKERWDQFVEQHPDPERLAEAEKIAMFRYAWEHPDRDAVEADAAVWKWRYEVMQAGQGLASRTDS